MLASTLFLFSAQVKGSTPSSTAHAPIKIEGNSDFTAGNGVVSGNGTASNPYIISGWSISSTVSACVDIEGTTAYFIIENLQVNCGSYTTASIALTLNTVSNGEVLSSYLFPAASILSSKNIVFSGNVVQGGGCGAQACLQTGQVLYITHSSSITVSNNQINLGQFNSCVVGTDFSSNLQFVNNTIKGGDVPCALGLYATNNSVISHNRITHPSDGSYTFANIGLSIYNSLSDQVFGNNITQEQNGITIVSTNGTSIYHNNLMNNKSQASESNSIGNQWDNGYPSGGNYWSDYKGVDNCGGLQQNVCRFSDGVGDTPYTFSDATDRYPLISQYTSPPSVQTGHASITINSNSGFTAGNGVTGGNGTDVNPYMISGWSIISDTGSIRITNTTAFFVVEYAIVGNGFGGIILHNVTNARVLHSSAGEYCDGGITVSSSRNLIFAYDWAASGSGSPNECGGDGMDVNSSSNVVVADSTFPWSQGTGLLISASNNVTVTGNSFTGSALYALDLGGLTNTVVSGNTFGGSGLWVSGLSTAPNSYAITSDNLVNGKPLYYYDGCGSGLTLDGVPVGELILVNCSNVRLANLAIHGTEVGITLVGVRNVLVENVNASQNHFEGMDVTSSSYLTVENSDFSLISTDYFFRDSQYGMILSGSNNTIVDGSRFCCEDRNLTISSSINATITNSSFTPNWVLFYLSASTGLHFFHNSFFMPSHSVGFTDTELGDSFDNGYPSGGNYWSSYTGVDNCSGSQQNICSSPDGIGDNPFPIQGGVYADHYPLVKPFVASPIVSVVIGTDGNLYSSVSRPDGSWNPWRSLSGSTSLTPAICRAGPDRVELVVRGMDNVIYLKSNINGTWSGSWESLAGLTPDQPACAVLNNTLYVAVRGMSGALYYQTVDLQTDTKSGWIYLGGASPSAPALCASGPSSLELLVRGDDNGLYHKSFSAGSWSSVWDKNTSGVIFDTPACAILGSTLYVAVRGAAQSLWTTTFDLSTRTWAISWTNLQGSTTSIPELVSTPSIGRLDLIVTGMDNVIYHKSFVNGSWSSTWDSPNGVTMSTPATVSDGSELRIVVVGTDDSLVSNILPLSSSSWSRWTSMSGSTNSAPSAG